MSAKIKIKTNPSPCKHTVVTVTEDGIDREIVFHDSDFEDDGFVPDADWKELHKVFKKRVQVTGKKFSKSKSDFHGKYFKNKIEDE